MAKQDRAAYGITLSTGLQASFGDSTKLVSDVRKIKQAVGKAPLALEVAPFSENCADTIQELKGAGLDTLMIPLDCASPEAQKRFMRGKARLLGKTYWENTREAVKRFGRGNVTSSIIVGLEPIEETERAIGKMIDEGIVPEPVPVRWQDKTLTRTKELLPITQPKMLVAMRQTIRKFMRQSEIGKTFEPTKTGCAACGGCGGIRFDRGPQGT